MVWSRKSLSCLQMLDGKERKLLSLPPSGKESGCRSSRVLSKSIVQEHCMDKGLKRILLIDEDIQVRESISLSLETAGYRVMVARTPQEGLRKYKNFQAMLVIMDVVGLEDKVDEVVQSFSRSSLPIPLITLTGNLPTSNGFLKLLQNDLQPSCTLQKPFTVDELLQAVRKALAI